MSDLEFEDNSDDEFEDNSDDEFEDNSDDEFEQQTNFAEDASDPVVFGELLERYDVIAEANINAQRVKFIQGDQMYSITLTSGDRQVCQIESLTAPSFDAEHMSISRLMRQMMNADLIQSFTNLFANYTIETNAMKKIRGVKHLNLSEDVKNVVDRIAGRTYFNRRANLIARMWDFILLIQDLRRTNCFVCCRYIGHLGVCSSEICVRYYLTDEKFNHIEDVKTSAEAPIYEILLELARCSVQSRRADSLLAPIPDGWTLQKIRDGLTITEEHPEPDPDVAWWVYARQKMFVNFTRIDGSTIGFPKMIVYEIDRFLDPKISGQIAYHGSPCENWLSIFNTGIQALSGTEHQLYGAAYGNGAYLAAEYSTSLGYVGENKPKIIAQCVIPTKFRANPYFVINEPNQIQLKYLIIDK